MRHFHDRYPVFVLQDGFFTRLADPVLADFVMGRKTAEEAREHIKVEEQKWIRKARRFLLYDDAPYRRK